VKLLLDTQVMLWWLLGDARLRASTRDLIARTACVVSVASIWEVSIKHRLGKLPVDPASFRDVCLAAGATVMPISDAHVIASGSLPDIHEDPFDRLLIAQAAVERCTAVSSDARWDGYGIALVRP
jgi:PIN domain nuclease of toxin-antitoxin system